jgi:hypothetical protein
MLQLAHTYITQAQVSTDGQWVFFTSETNGQAALQMIRMDGQGLQTLYCISANNLYDTQWSPDQKWVAFSVTPYPTPSPVTSPTVFLLNTTDGTIRTVLSLQGLLPGSGGSCCLRLTWLDNTHIYCPTVNPVEPKPSLVPAFVGGAAVHLLDPHFHQSI